MITVKLTREELRLAAQLGIERRLDSMFGGLKETAEPGVENVWDRDITGALGELAAAKILGGYWDTSLRMFKRPDVGELYIRTTRLKDGHLILRPGDPSGVYVLMFYRLNEATMVGWIDSLYGMETRYKRAPAGRPFCYMVPQPDLNKPRELVAYAKAKMARSFEAGGGAAGAGQSADTHKGQTPGAGGGRPGA